mmetsp:Transcript_4878/g.10274  ORF Transcript_4878/g.10274 Transcript_4878/m.10274 type:complete len:219 (-) Transcript_4878:164-820(-)
MAKHCIVMMNQISLNHNGRVSTVCRTSVLSFNASLRLSSGVNFTVRCTTPRLLPFPSSHILACLCPKPPSFVCVMFTFSHLSLGGIIVKSSLLSASSVWQVPASSDGQPIGTSSGGSSSTGQVLNKMTLLPHFSSGSNSGAPFVKGNSHKSVGLGTAWSIEPSKRKRRPGTAGTVTSSTCCSFRPAFVGLCNKSPPVLHLGKRHVGPRTSVPTWRYST